MSSNCEYYQHLMSQMLDADLLDAETDALREHTRTCAECRKLCAAFSSMTLCLRDDQEEPPASLAKDVMAQIYAAETKAAAEPSATPVAQPMENTIESLSPRSRRIVRRWPTYAAAACLVILIGAGLTTSLRSRMSAANATGAATPETAMAVTTTDDEYLSHEAAMEESAQVDTAQRAAAGTAQSYSMADSAPIEDAAENLPDSGSAHSILDPAQVPEGRESDFEALLTDAGWPNGEPDVTWHSLYAAEYRGVIYEFLTDDQEQYLVWHDAAEGLYTHSAAAVDDLWNIFGN